MYFIEYLSQKGTSPLQPIPSDDMIKSLTTDTVKQSKKSAMNTIPSTTITNLDDDKITEEAAETWTSELPTKHSEWVSFLECSFIILLFRHFRKQTKTIPCPHKRSNIEAQQPARYIISRIDLVIHEVPRFEVVACIVACVQRRGRSADTMWLLVVVV